ncbi:glutathione S-transferase family protein [Aureimonas phyllosphaerae]|uniref:glutathione transferase n=1 Tax=Aureimonas phyllosphaerae TaxID=1166078 RepID=A0A7W6FSJ4_9HYPH|nr:glutathione S-transferase [Aureimonas phyllosphaerae]MBB3934021.1 glutathione S-transferase [Aureimonas phyllosphaerae]MBB3958763.1 glutathione S-transferase [Aureimonas phyllosphaerae]SFF18961.1 glutathione S-transferase [Aureimonas phyllosphaerae]
MITVHHLNNSRSQRVLWLLEELGVPYEVKRYERLKSLLAPPELKRVHPLGKSPVLTEGELTLAETGAIVTYVAETHGGGRFQPERGSADWWRMQHFLHHAEGSAMPPLFMKLVFARIPGQAPFIVRPVAKALMRGVDTHLLAPRLADLLDYWDASLAQTGWFAGPEPTLADVMMSFPLEAAGARIGFGHRRHLAAFVERVHARPAFRAALERGGPYAYA